MHHLGHQTLFPPNHNITPAVHEYAPIHKNSYIYIERKITLLAHIYPGLSINWYHLLHKELNTSFTVFQQSLVNRSNFKICDKNILNV